MSAKNNHRITFNKLKVNILLSTLFVVIFSNVFASSESTTRNLELFQLDRNTEILNAFSKREMVARNWTGK